MWILFEDSDCMPVSNLIRYAYKDTDVKLAFVGGSGSFLGFINENVKENEFAVIMFDLVPDNFQVIKCYRTLCTRIRHKRNIIVIPVLPSDQVVLKAFTNIDTNPEVILSNGIDMLLEKYYKHLLDNYSECMSLGRYTDKTDKTAAFYKYDCLCDYEKDCKRVYTRINKGLDLVAAMPCYYGIEDIKSDGIFDFKDYTLKFLTRHNKLVKMLSVKYNWTKAKTESKLIDIDRYT